MDELKPCKCGNTVIDSIEDELTMTYIQYVCTICGRETPICDTEKEAAAAWNVL